MDKKDIVLKKKKSSNLIFIGIIAVLLVSIGLLVIPGGSKENTTNEEVNLEPLKEVVKGNDSRYQNVEDVDGVVTFPISSFDDSAQYFEYSLDGIDIRFFILKSNDGTIRAAFDACDVCYRSRRGYDQVGDYMRCNNCGQTFPEDKINVVVGGCNPSPLEREIVGDNLIIKVSDIATGKRFF